MTEVIQEGVVRVGFEDREVEAGLDRLVAKTKADLAAIGREKAIINVTYHVEDAKRALADAKAGEKELAAAVKAREKALKDADSSQKGGYTSALNASKRALESQREEIKTLAQHARQLEDFNRAQRRAQDSIARGSREQAVLDRAAIAAAKEKARLARDAEAQAGRDHTSALRAAESDAKRLAIQKQQLALQERIRNLEKASGRAQGTDKQRVELDTARAIADFKLLQERLRLMGDRPIELKTKVGTSGLGKVADLFGFGQRDQIKDLHTRLLDVAKGAKNARIQLGFMSGSLGGIAAGAAALAPIITGLIGTIGALISSVGAGLGGALGLGAAGMTGFGLAAIGMVSTLKPFIGQLTLAHKYVTAHNLAIAKYGAQSKKGQAATAQFNHEMKNLTPAAAETVKGFDLLRTRWQKLTQTVANKQIGNIVGATFKTVKADMGFFAKDTNQAFTAVGHSWSGLMAQFRSPAARAGLDTIFTNFNKTIPGMFDALGHLAAVVGRGLANFSKYLPRIVHGFDAWANRLDQTSKNADGFSHGINTMVTSFKDLVHFLGAATRFLFTFFKAGVGPGNGLVNNMTDSLNKLSDSMATVAGQTKLHNFFTRSIDTTKQLWAALLPVVSAFVQFSQVMAPAAAIGLHVVSMFTRLAAAAVSFKPLRWVVGLALGISIVGRLTSGLWEMGRAAGAGWLKLVEFDRLLKGGGGFKASFKEAFGGTNVANQILAAHKEGAVLMREVGAQNAEEMAAAMRGAGAADAAEIAAAMEAAGATAASEIGAAEALGGAGGAGRGLLSRGAGALGIIGLGVTAAQLGGDAIGGKGGTAVSNIGTGAAVGAGLGSLFGPEGTFAGAMVGGMIGAFKTFAGHLPDLGKEAADKYTKPFGDSLARATGHAADKTLADLTNKAITTSNPQLSRGGRPARIPDVPQAVQQKGWDAVGKRAGDDFIKAFGQAKVQTQFLFIQDAQRQLDLLKPRARQAAAQTMLQFAAGMVENGKMSKQAFAGLIASLEVQVPGLQAYLKKAGLNTARDFTNNLNFSAGKTKIAAALNDYRNKFSDFSIDPNVTGKNLWKNMNAAMQDLTAIMHSGPKSQRIAAMKEYKALQGEANQVFKSMVDQTGSHMQAMKSFITGGSKNAASVATKAFNSMVANIQTAMASGAVSTSQGMRLIAQATDQLLSAFGAGHIPIPDLVHAQQLAATKGVGPGALLNPGSGNKALGGRVPGPVGPDNWTLVGPDGQPRARVGGSELLIANRHTEADASRATMMLYGQTLGQMVNNESRPHSAPQRFATGGTVVRGRVSTFGPPGEAAGSTALAGHSSSEPGLSLHIPGTHFSDPSNRALMGHMFRVTINGHSANLPDIDLGPADYVNRAIDVTGAGAKVLGFGANFPTDAIGTAVELGAGAVIKGVSGSTGQVTAPHVRGKGAIAKIANAALARVARAANKYVNSHLPAFTPASSLSGVGGGHAYKHGSLTFPLPSGSWTSGALDQGWDVAAAAHTPEYAVGPGTIVGHGISGFGNWAPILRLNSGDAVYYGHAGPGNWTPTGTHVRAGQVISEVGAGIVGISTGPHLEIGWYPPGVRSGASMKSALGYEQGGRVSYAGAFAKGGAFTTNGPTVGMFGENGRETVIAIPHAATGRRVPQQIGHGQQQPKTTHHSGAVPHPNSYLYALKPKDRIGGVGTDDLDAAVTAAQHAFGQYWHNIHTQTHKVQVPTTHTSQRRTRHVDSRGRVSYTTSQSVSHGSTTKTVKGQPTQDQKDQAHKLYERFQKLKKLDTQAKEDIQNFANMETEMGTLQSYMDAAGNSSSDSSEGYDPTTGKRVTKKWADWKSDLMKLEHKHTSMLRTAARDVVQATKGDKRASTIAFVRAVQAALGTSITDEGTAAALTDPSLAATGPASPDDYIAMLPKTWLTDIQRLNYGYSLAQGNNVADNPGTAVREDLESLRDDRETAGGIMEFYKRLLRQGQGDPRVRANLPLLTSLSDAFNSAQSTWQGLNDQFTGAASATGPTQVQTWGAARQNLFDQFSGNFANEVFSSPGTLGAQTAGNMLAGSASSGAPMANPGSNVPQNVKHVNITNHYAVPPENAHSWSQGLGWELEHAL